MITFMPRQEFHNALEQARSDFAEWARIRNSPDPKNDRDFLMLNRQATMRTLQSIESSVRLAGISLVADYWPCNEQFAAEVLRLAFEDPESAIRGGAVLALLHHKQFINDPTGFLRRLLTQLFPSPPSQVISERKAALLEKMAAVSKECKTWWQEMAGEHSSCMEQSRMIAESYLDHPDPMLRQAALLAIMHEWKPDEEFVRRCESLLCEDPDVGVQSVAMSCLASCFKGSDDTRIGRLTARLVYDNTNEVRLRRAAYASLFTIRGMPSKLVVQATSPTFLFPEEVNWEFVDSFLDSSPPGHGKGNASRI